MRETHGQPAIGRDYLFIYIGDPKDRRAPLIGRVLSKEERKGATVWHYKPTREQVFLDRKLWSPTYRIVGAFEDWPLSDEFATDPHPRLKGVSRKTPIYTCKAQTTACSPAGSRETRCS